MATLEDLRAACAALAIEMSTDAVLRLDQCVQETEPTQLRHLSELVLVPLHATFRNARGGDTTAVAAAKCIASVLRLG